MGVPEAELSEEIKVQGLSRSEVEERVRLGKTNYSREVTSRSYWHIIRANVFTRFNAILGTLFVIILVFGQPRDALFGIVLACNTLIGIIQEIRAKRTLDRLSILVTPRAKVVREGALEEIDVADIVEDDILFLSSGDQVSVDGSVVSSAGLEIDESLLTGESVPVVKRDGDEVFSGTFAVAGSGYVRAVKVGEEAYARRLSREARKFAVAPSELRNGINMILRFITYIMFPVAAVLFLSQYRYYGSFGESVPGVVAGLVGMVPEGLVLLTSVAFAVSVITLGRRKVLVQELPAVEGLARVDVICLDKTGTLTDGTLKFSRIVPVSENDVRLDVVLAAFAHHTSVRNQTVEAIAGAFPQPEGWISIGEVPFSSLRKWSSVRFQGGLTWILGAPEVLLERCAPCEGLLERVNEYARTGTRVLLFARSSEPLSGESLPAGIEPAALVLFEENVRPDAGRTLEYFKSQNVRIKLISGDNPVTVAAVASKVGVADSLEPVDARTLPEDMESLSEVLEEKTVFGRVVPEQKRRMVEALQEKGHVVAMTGDGVNDALALKKADVGIAMGSGSPASRAVSQLVLLDGRFETLPGVLAEGRRIIANIERVANLFLTKNVYSTLLSLIIGFAGWAFLFLPRHLTLISAVTIGTPAFFLSFAPTRERYRPGFVRRVLYFSIPSGIVSATAAIFAGSLAHIHLRIPFSEARTTATLVLAIIGIWVLGALARPLTPWRGALLLAMVLALVIVFSVPFFLRFFELDVPGPVQLLQCIGIAGLGCAVVEVIWRISRRLMVR